MRRTSTTPVASTTPSKTHYATQMVPLAARIVAAVHDDGPDELREALGRALAVTPAAGVDPYVTLTVILAAMVDPARSPQQLLAWTGPLGGVDAVTPPPPSTVDIGADRARLDPRVVEFCVDGLIPASRLRPRERAEAVRILSERGFQVPEIAGKLGVTIRTVQRLRAAARQQNGSVAA
ncbi:helix-turn-helix domain-containing protein [Crossiella sp. SN42]|uniref:helix-turn-helix domain-containing protein n=1 Tax=Crossiella sp. SN42 TaxID=2944808 RepID=UPI00207C8E1A|nr:helix-turn-helix domain-containing protein [Crossiella sp. SN42]MCO1575004.1 helix-turn-helix domain-containing protein [Crossiella sp. SN42]